jgi:hypothetical protein
MEHYEKTIAHHPPRNFEENHFNNKPEYCPRVLTINKPIN